MPRTSELRFHELLEGLCKQVSEYHLNLDGRWVRPRPGQESSHSDPEARVRRRSESRQIQNYCERLLEQHEDDLVLQLKSPKQAMSKTGRYSVT